VGLIVICARLYCHDIILKAPHFQTHNTGTMETIEGMVFLILGMWLFLTARRKNVFKMRLMAAKQKYC